MKLFSFSFNRQGDLWIRLLMRFLNFVVRHLPRNMERRFPLCLLVRCSSDKACLSFRFRSIAKSYFRKADGVLLLYDVTCETSFIDVRDWVEAIEVSGLM